MVIANIRDISIIFLAFESIIVLVLLSVLIVQVRNLVILLNEEIRPMLEASQETADTVRNTTTFVGKYVAQPFVNVVSFGAGLRQAAKTLANGGKPPTPTNGSTPTKTEQAAPEPVTTPMPDPPADSSDMESNNE
jgi:hypothetical protein